MNKDSKLKNLDELSALLVAKKAEGKKIVHAHGVFDLLHVGHIRHLQVAKSLGDVLVVTLTPDQYVNKGPHRPAFPQELRAESLAALETVDYVAINRWPTSVETIKLLRPSIYVKGCEFKDTGKDITGAVSIEAEAVAVVGGEIRFTEDISFSSSNLLNRYFSSFPPEVEGYLESFRARHSIDEVLGWLDKVSSLRPLVVGEAIVDEYLFCNGLGKSTKDPVLAVQQQGLEAFPGGTLAIANHVAGLCQEVMLVTQLGDSDRREDFVHAKLCSNVTPILLTKSGSPTIHKRRVVDHYSGTKLLEIYQMNDQLSSAEDTRRLVSNLKTVLNAGAVDLTIAADYGHGMFNDDSIKVICDSPSFLSLNVQCNAGNRGLNSISKYFRADYVCMASHELAMEIREKQVGKHEKVKLLSRRIDCPRYTVTYGKSGTLHYDSSGAFHEAPSLAVKVVDRVGAGDAVLAVTSLLVKLGAPWDMVGFIGNAAGAMLVAELGNRVPLNKVTLSRYLVSVLK